MTSCPNTVFRGIWSVIIKTLQGMLRRRTRTHVREESGKRIGVAPTLTDGDAATAVIRITDMRRRVAATTHLRPGLPFGRLPLAVLAGVLIAGMGLAVETAATARLPAFELMGDNGSEVAAIAAAVPAALAVLAAPGRAGVVEDDETAEALALEIVTE